MNKEKYVFAKLMSFLHYMENQYEYVLHGDV